MSERLRFPANVTAVRLGRTMFGEAAIVLEDDALYVAVREAPSERPVRVALSSVEGAVLESGEVTVLLQGGTRLALASESAAEIRQAILDYCRALPELTSALRTFGSRRGNRSGRETAADEQRRFFAPLLRARRDAGEAHSPNAAIAAFDIAALVESTHRALRGYAEARFAESGPGRRALEAHLFDANEPLDDSFQLLVASAVEAAAAVDDLARWRAWSAQLRATFEAADRAWLAVDAVLEAAPLPMQKGTKQPSQKGGPSSKQTLKRS